MSIKLTKDTTATPDVYSTETGADPVIVVLTLNGTNSPTTVTGTPATSTYVWADDDTTLVANYSAIVVSIQGSDTGITWEVSANGSTGWGSSINLSSMDVSTTYQTTQVYVRATALNDGSIATGSYSTPDVKIAATENPV